MHTNLLDNQLKKIKREMQRSSLICLHYTAGCCSALCICTCASLEKQRKSRTEILQLPPARGTMEEHK